jgi:hypothetical protein
MLAKLATIATVATAAVALAGCGIPPDRHSGDIRHEAQSVDLGGTEMTRVDIRMSAGELRVEGGASKLLDADFTYDDEGRKPSIRYSTLGSRGQLSIEQPGGTGIHRNHESRWSLRFNNDQPLDITARFGAGEARMDLGSLNLRGLEINMGVGELQLDLRGNPKRDYDVRVHGGVGEATIRLPKHVGIRATATGGIGDIEVRGLEKRGNRWINPGHEDDPVTIRVEVAGGIGQIRLIAE